MTYSEAGGDYSARESSMSEVGSPLSDLVRRKGVSLAHGMSRQPAWRRLNFILS